MPSGHAGGSSAVVTLVVIGLVVVRFLMRELRPRRIARGRMFVAPAITAVLAVAIWGYVASDRPDLGILVPGTVAALVVGGGVGWLVARFTSVSVDAGAAASLRGSYLTVAIWVVALLLRFAGRLAVGTSDLHATLALNAALVVLLASALLTSRFLFSVRANALRAAAPLRTGAD